MPAKPKFNLDEVAKRFTAVKPKLMTDLEAISTNFFVNSWRIQGWDNGQVEKWPEVERRKPGTAAYKSATKRARERAILVGKGSGKLRRAFYTRIKRMDIIQIANSMPYAKFHNEGVNGVAHVKSHQRWVKAGEYEGSGIYNIKTRKEKRVELQYKQQVKAYTRKVRIPQRQFMNHSPTLGRMQEKSINKHIKMCFK